MKRLLYSVCVLVVFIGCHRMTPIQPTYHTLKDGQTNVAIPLEDTALFRIMEYNERRAELSKEFLRRWVVLENNPQWVLDEDTYWYLRTERGTGVSLSKGDTCMVHIRTTRLKGNLLYDEQKEIVIGRREVIVAVDEFLQQCRVGDKAELLVPWYIAYGQFGNDIVPPYDEVHVYVDILTSNDTLSLL